MGIANRIAGSWINSSVGDIFRAEYLQSLNEPYGHVTLSDALYLRREQLIRVFPELPADFSMKNVIFLDTETTGLTQGGGSLAFLIGLAWIEGQNFIVHQYFADQPFHEEGMLELIKPILDGFPVLVTFNGKTYDVPLLNTRFILNRMPPLTPDRAHLDLLHRSRALWKYSLADCRLGTLEKDILEIFRDEDIPGEMIPATYFDYLKFRKTDDLEKVFIHNRYDMISMLAVLLEIVKESLLEDRHSDPLVDYALARISTKTDGGQENSRKYYEKALEGDLSTGRKQAAMLELAALHKRSGRISEALNLWKTILRSPGPFCLDAYVETAKVYEHRYKSYTDAESFTEEAINKLPTWLEPKRQELRHRLERIKRKMKTDGPKKK